MQYIQIRKKIRQTGKMTKKETQKSVSNKIKKVDKMVYNKDFFFRQTSH